MKSAKRFIIIHQTCCLLFFLGLNTVFAAAPQSDPVVGPRDILSISVFDEPALSMTVVVSASGEFSYPLLKVVKAAGKTAFELGVYMETRLKKEKFLQSPSVSVMIKEQKSATVVLSGAIKTPGSIPVYPGMRLRELLSTQGGILSTEAGPYIYIDRSNGEIITVDREALMKSKGNNDPKINHEVLPGDEIIVPEANDIYVLGAVNKPGGYPLTRKMTLGDALGLAGGRKDNAGNAMLWHHFGEDNQPVLITFTYNQLIKDPTAASAVIQAGESLYITPQDSIFVSGEVEKPGMLPWQPEMTLLTSLTAAGGPKLTAGNTITLIRESPDGRQVKKTYKLNDIKRGKGMDEKVFGGDLIYLSPNILKLPYTIRQVNPFSLPVTLFGGQILSF